MSTGVSQVSRSSGKRVSSFWMYSLQGILLFVLAVFVCYGLRHTYVSGQNNALQWYSLANHDLRSYEDLPEVQDLSSQWYDMGDVFRDHTMYVRRYENTLDYYNKLKKPYEYVLSHILLPSLNIWEDPHTQEIDVGIIGQRFLEENPYTDLALIDRWAHYFEDISPPGADITTDLANQISNVRIESIKEFDSGLFAIPITLSFSSANRRSFLLLMEKLSMTSHETNIRLLNEFFFVFWEHIKDVYAEQIDAIEFSENSFFRSADIDTKLGYILHEWIHDRNNYFPRLMQMKQELGQPAPSLHDLVQQSIRLYAGCSNESNQECDYMLRQKLRSLPYLAYPLTNARVDRAQVLQEFLKDLPPVIYINQFSFDTKEEGVGQTSYVGEISIYVYGRGVSEEQQQRISQHLAGVCTSESSSLSPGMAIGLVQARLTDLGSIDMVDSHRADQLKQLLGLLESIQGEYESMTPYEQTIQLFSMYRMLTDNMVCSPG